MKKRFLLFGLFVALMLSGCIIEPILNDRTRKISCSISAEEECLLSVGKEEFKLLKAGETYVLDKDCDQFRLKDPQSGHIFYETERFSYVSFIVKNYEFGERRLFNSGWGIDKKEKGLFLLYECQLKVNKALMAGRYSLSPGDFVIGGGVGAPDCPKHGMSLVYMIADNDLLADAIRDINKMEEGYRGKGKLIVFVDAPQNSLFGGAVLLDIQNDFSDEIVSSVIYRFDKSIDSCSPEVMKNVIAKFVELRTYQTGIFKQNPSVFGGEYSYSSLILWSHGSGWIPGNTEADNTLLSFGQDDSEKSQVDIHFFHSYNHFGTGFKWLIFDACYMGGIEFLEGFKSPIPVIASPVEMSATVGFPYDNPDFMEQLLLPKTSAVQHKADFESAKQIVDAIVNEYESNGKELILTLYSSPGSELKNKFKIDFASFHSNTAIKPFIEVESGKACFYFDFLDFCKALNGGYEATEIKTLLEQNSYTKKTPTLLGGKDSAFYSGFSCYIPYHTDEMVANQAEMESINRYYSSLDWVKDSKLLENAKPIY